MAQSQDTFNKKEKEKKRLKKRQDKQAKKEERKSNPSGGGLDSMIAYVDEFGNLTDTPQDPTKKNKVNIDSIEISVRKKDDEEVPAMRTGRVDFYNDSKGFGFIKEQDTQEKYFVHVSGLEQPIKEGDQVTFELQRGAKGMNAFNVKKV
jgi:cold shock CspA family protein